MKGFIVLPPGHGKSVLHNPEKHIFEADQLYNYKEDKTLVLLRDEAKKTGDWAMYDKIWGQLLGDVQPALTVVLVPTKAIGDATGGVWLGSCRLPWTYWKVNFLNRKGWAEKYRRCWEDVANHQYFYVGTNDETTERVHKLVTDHLEDCHLRQITH